MKTGTIDADGYHCWMEGIESPDDGQIVWTLCEGPRSVTTLRGVHVSSDANVPRRVRK